MVYVTRDAYPYVYCYAPSYFSSRFVVKNLVGGLAPSTDGSYVAIYSIYGPTTLVRISDGQVSPLAAPNELMKHVQFTHPVRLIGLTNGYLMEFRIENSKP